jgi:O-antigen/teichoic acid export membrane protein
LPSDSSYDAPVGGLRGKVTRGAAWTSGFFLASKVVELVFTAILARLLAPTEFGVVAAALIFIYFARLFVEIGIGPTIVQLQDLTRKDLRTAGVLVMLSALLLFGLTQLFAPGVAMLLGIPESEGVLRLLAFMFLLQAVGIVPENLLLRRLRAPSLMMVETSARLVGYGGVGALCAWAGLGYWSLAIGALADAFLKAVAVTVLVRPPLAPLLHGPSVRRLLSRGVGFSISRVLNYVATTADKVITARFLGAAALGVYGRAYQLMSLPADIYGRVGDRLVFPALAACQGEPKRLRRAFLTGVSATATVGLPFSIVLVLLAPEIITFLLGLQWLEVIAPLMVLAAASYFRLGAKAGGSLLRATGSFHSLVGSQLLYAVGVVAGCLLAAPYGVNAIAAVVSCMAFGLFVLSSVLACKRCEIPLVEFMAVHRHGALLAILSALLLGSLVAALRAINAPDYIILGASGLLLASAAIILLIYTPVWLLGRPGAQLAADTRMGLRRRFVRSAARPGKAPVVRGPA